MKMKVSKGIDKKIIAKAEKILSDLYNGVSIAVKVLKDHGHMYRSIKVNLRYRLLEKRGVWHLLTHEAYNKAIKF